MLLTPLLVLVVLAPASHRNPGDRRLSDRPPRSAPSVACRNPRPSRRPPAAPGGRLRQSPQPSGGMALRGADARNRPARVLRDGDARKRLARNAGGPVARVRPECRAVPVSDRIGTVT